METKSYRALACCASSSYRSTHYGSAVPASGFRRDAHCQTAHRTGATTGRGGGSWDGRRRTRTARQGARSPVPPCRSARARRPAIIRTAFRAIVCRRVPGPAARPVRRPTARDLIVRIRGPGGAAFQHVSSRYTHTRGPERPSSSVRRTRFSLTDLRKSEPDITSAKWHVAVGGGGAGVSVTGRRRRCGFRHPRPAVRAVRANRGSARFGVVLAVAPRGPHRAPGHAVRSVVLF